MLTTISTFIQMCAGYGIECLVNHFQRPIKKCWPIKNKFTRNGFQLSKTQITRPCIVNERYPLTEEERYPFLHNFRHVQLFATPWTAARQASLSITSSWSPSKPSSIESVMPSNHLILCHPLLLLPPIFPSIRVFSNESALRIRWPKY